MILNFSIKKLIRSIIELNLKMPIPNFFIKYFEIFISRYQGKGWGSTTIKHEISTCLFLLKKRPKIFIDVGANKGNYTKNIIKKIPDIECYLFEPSKVNFSFLKKSFKNKSGLNIYNLALSNKNGMAILYSNKPGSELSSLTKRRLDHFNINMNYEEEVKLIRLDNFWEDKDKIIDYLKIDAEGHEYNILEGLGDLIFKIKLIQFEFGGCNIDTKTYFQDFWYFFNEKNFSIIRINPRGVKKINSYKEEDEYFKTTNYIALNNNLMDY